MTKIGPRVGSDGDHAVRPSQYSRARPAARSWGRPARRPRRNQPAGGLRQRGSLERLRVITERRPMYELQWLPFAFGSRGETVPITLASFNIDEMLATKMRAMFQRKKGRDLFDLYWASCGIHMLLRHFTNGGRRPRRRMSRSSCVGNS